MIFITIVFGILQSVFISLGVGSSTLAIINFFAAIADGTIDETERRMMGIVYVVLRVAMVGILVTTAALHIPVLLATGVAGVTSVMLGQWSILIVLYGNALLMTKRMMPSTFGPGLQAGSWYSLGIMMALQLQGIQNFTLLQFTLGYIMTLILAVGLVNLTMSVLKSRRQNAA